jgi:UDP-2,3-diacylglucosamine pyrophosphatase LpxH
MTLVRQVFVISDLHLGGEYGESNRPDDRGFRLCTQLRTLTEFVQTLSRRPNDSPRTELVINGDFVDFLAEYTPEARAQRTFVPFVADPAQAAAKLEAIIKRDRPFFDALTAFLERGHRLVVLLGNHDLELALPLVRRMLRHALQISGRHDFQFVYDGEAYVVGDALIEHGNQYDPWNKVNHGALGRLRSWQSRSLTDDVNHGFNPPAGSRLVAEVINAIKAEYRFVDLLKPETEAVVPLLLALEPGYRRHIGRIAALCVARTRASMWSAVTGDVAATGFGDQGFGRDLVARPGRSSETRSRAPVDPLRTLLEDLMPGQSTEFLAAVDEDVDGDIAAGDAINRWHGLMRLVISSTEYERRLDALRQALGVLERHRAFDRSTESLAEYREAAVTLASRGFRYVIFGHTHLARDVQLTDKVRYFNTGTWADVIQFPADVLEDGDIHALRDFVEQMKTGAVSRWINFRPTYVRLDVDESGHVARGELVEYERASAV